MIIVFVGPSLPDATQHAGADIDIRPPAVQGDILGAVEDGAATIGLIDGGFEYAPAVWHKEILYALSKGISVCGAASMGALRAAECRAFGMSGIGEIYRRYACGDYVDDSDVALLHAPAELRYTPLTVPMVNVDATLDTIRASDALPSSICDDIEAAARRIFYKRRTWSIIADKVAMETRFDRRILLDSLKSHAVDQKQRDAQALLEAMPYVIKKNGILKYNLEFFETSIWRHMRNLRSV